ncbi:C45 family autoproteolytic acyltransferase/hydolase [Acetobacterium wieringae]|uniref:C45 family autoproteolytic acyltransferase/hydolase n=1 Tax=Acetobacterium wieringae TaxID=52694 RepID=UPI0026F223AF|nr:C45 family autoproteolytic acyltransferase/hydolase [Acetobacterium wieringae]
MNNKMKLSALCFLCLSIGLLLMGCQQQNTANDDTSSSVTLERKDDAYFYGEIDLTQMTHTQMGEAYAQAIVNVFPDYEAHVDSMLKDQFDLLAAAKDSIGYDLNFELCKSRATDIQNNIQPEYQEEIAGLQKVFNYDNDVLGDGRLSKNEMLVYQMFGDVMRPTQCSGAAVFGESSATGNTIVGRNLDWDLLQHDDASAMHTVLYIKNGDKSIVMFNILGLLVPISGFSDDHVFLGTLDAETLAPYPDTRDKKSYCFDFRDALENTKTLEEAAAYLSTENYTMNHLVLLADATKAQVLENNIGSPGRGLRSWDSTLQPGMIWGIKDTIATVNDFRLVDNFATPDDPIDDLRWESYRNNITNALTTGKIDVDKMKAIVGYSGTDGKPIPSGAVFRSDHIPSIQSMVIRMDNLETWIAFKPSGSNPLHPTYVEVFANNPFANDQN